MKISRRLSKCIVIAIMVIFMFQIFPGNTTSINTSQTTAYTYDTLVVEQDRVIVMNGTGDTQRLVLQQSNVIDADFLENGNILIADLQKVIELDPDGNIVWQKTGLVDVFDADRLKNGNTLICEPYRSRVIEVDSTGDIVWSLDNLKYPMAAERMVDGNTVISETYLKYQVSVYEPDGTVIWTTPRLGHPVFDVEVLASGNIMIVEVSGYEYEWYDETGNYHWYRAGRITEWDISGDIVWTYYPQENCYDIDVLSNDNVLMAHGFEYGRFLTEVTRSGDVVWEYVYAPKKSGFRVERMEPDLPEDAIDNLIDDIMDLDIPDGLNNSLISKLDSALDSMDRDNNQTAINQLESFINSVEAQRGKKLTDDEADALIAVAEAAIELLENTG